MHQLVVDQNCSEWKCLAALLKIHYALRAVRNGAHEYEHLNKSPLEHHHLFGATWGDLLRTKHHLRLHLASIYRKLDTQILSHAKKMPGLQNPSGPNTSMFVQTRRWQDQSLHLRKNVDAKRM